MHRLSWVVPFIVGVLCVSLNSESVAHASLVMDSAPSGAPIVLDAAESEPPPVDESAPSQWVTVTTQAQSLLFGLPNGAATNLWLDGEPSAGVRRAGHTDLGDTFEFECLRTIQINDYLDRSQVSPSELARLATMNSNPLAVFGLMKKSGIQLLVLAVVPTLEANGSAVYPFVVSNVIPVIDHTACVDAFHFMEAAMTVAAASRPVYGPPVPDCDNVACDDGMRQCRDNLDSANDACEALALGALAALALCAVGMTLALEACILTGAGCGLLVWMGSLCSQLPAALAAIASCFALALAAYGMCNARVRQWSACSCIAEW